MVCSDELRGSVRTFLSPRVNFGRPNRILDYKWLGFRHRIFFAY